MDFCGRAVWNWGGYSIFYRLANFRISRRLVSVRATGWKHLVWAEIAVMMVVLPWLWGGRWEGSWIVLGVSALIVAGSAGWGFRRGGLELRNGGKSRVWRWLALACWTLLAAQISVSCFNACFEWKLEASGGRRLVRREFIELLPTTINRERTVRFAVAWLSIVSIGWVAGAFSWGRTLMRRWLLVVFANASMLAMIGLWFRLSGSEKMLGFADPVNIWFFATYRYPNHWVAFAIMGLCAGIAWIFGSRSPLSRRDYRWLGAVGIVYLMLSFPVSNSRTGMIFASLILIILLGTFLFKGRSMSRNTKWGAVLGVSMLAMVAAFFGRDAFESRWPGTVQEWKQFHEEGQLDIRFGAAPRDTMKLIRTRPVWGWGAGSYMHAFPFVAGDGYEVHMADRIARARLEFAHNDWLQFLSELGVVGCLLLWVPFAALIIFHRFPWRSGSHCRWVMLGVGLDLAFAGWDFPFSNFSIFAVGVWIGVLVLCEDFRGNRIDSSGEKRESGRHLRNSNELPGVEGNLSSP